MAAKKQSRFRSKVAIVSILSGIALIFNKQIKEYLGMDNEQVNTVINLILGGLVSFGILNDPTTNNKF